jgi:hypothetical protein
VLLLPKPPCKKRSGNLWSGNLCGVILRRIEEFASKRLANSMMSPRRFPPPWSAEVTPNCFIVRDANGQALSYIYCESEPGRRSPARLLSKDEARRIAANIVDSFRMPLNVPRTLGGTLSLISIK